jgi:hypothetical protein
MQQKLCAGEVVLRQRFLCAAAAAGDAVTAEGALLHGDAVVVRCVGAEVHREVESLELARPFFCALLVSEHLQRELRLPRARLREFDLEGGCSLRVVRAQCA